MTRATIARRGGTALLLAAAFGCGGADAKHQSKSEEFATDPVAIKADLDKAKQEAAANIAANPALSAKAKAQQQAAVEATVDARAKAAAAPGGDQSAFENLQK